MEFSFGAKKSRKSLFLVVWEAAFVWSTGAANSNKLSEPGGAKVQETAAEWKWVMLEQLLQTLLELHCIAGHIPALEHSGIGTFQLF